MNKLNPGEDYIENYAPLTAGLLARKGEACPATDAEAHEGIDLDDYGPPHAVQVSRDRQEKISAPNPHETDKHYAPSDGAAPIIGHEEDFPIKRFMKPAALGLSKTTASKIVDVEPEALAPEGDAKTTPARDPAPKERPAKRRRTQIGMALRLEAQDFVRLILASRKLNTSCQAILREALECYLDANEIAQIPEAFCEREAERIAKIMKNRRGALSRR